MGDAQLQSVGNDQIQLMQTLIDNTWKDATTRDRGFKKPPKLQVVMVQQNCNPELWAKYCRSRNKTLSAMLPHQTVTCKTGDAMQTNIAAFQAMFGTLETDANEFLLFHGSKPSAVEHICKSNFNVQLAGSNVGSLYGPGLYFSENSSKSDEYAADGKTGIYAGLYAMLLCRVTCGRILYTDKADPDKAALTRQCRDEKKYDCILGDREKAKGTYREFVLFDNAQVYPECVVLYRRATD
jgi:hypothetical protein